MKQSALDLQLELLRMRAALERAQLTDAATDLTVQSHRLKRWAGWLSLGGTLLAGGRRAGWGATALALLQRKPLLAAAGWGAAKLLKRHPLAALSLALAALGLAFVGRTTPRSATSNTSNLGKAASKNSP